MISIYKVKPAFQRLLRPCMHGLAKVGVTPNQVTMSAIGLSLAGGVLISFSKHYPALLLSVPLMLLVRMGLNALDGMLAREYKQSSLTGEILNEVGDIVSDTLLYLPLMFLFYDSVVTVLLIAAFLVLACLSEFCGVLVKSLTGERRYDGPMGKSDRAFVISVLALGLYFWPALIYQIGTTIFLTLNALLVLSCVNRLCSSVVSRKGIIHE